MTDDANYYLDITGEVCPLTFVKTKLLIERMLPGQICEVRLRGAEPLGNVPRSVRDMGHEILAFDREPGEGDHGIHRLRIRRT